MQVQLATGGNNVSKFYLEIPLHDFETEHIYHYDCIVAEGDNLTECLGSAIVRVVDSEGVVVDIAPADASWMLQLVELEYARVVAGLESPRKLKVLQ